MKTKSTKLYKIVPDNSAPEFPRVKITSVAEAVNCIRQFYFEDIEVYESSFLLMLNRGGYTIAWAKISQGGITGTVVDPLLVAKFCVDSLAKSVILCHNHPSGNIDPSPADEQLTIKISQALKLLDVNLNDHIILTKDRYYSFAEEGKI